MKKALNGSSLKLKKNTLSRQLGISRKKKIPLTLLRKIQKSKAGQTIRNPTKTGNRIIKVTPKLERRAIFALRFKRRK